MIKLKCNECKNQRWGDITKHEPGEVCPLCESGFLEDVSHEKEPVLKQQTGETMANIGCNKCSYIRFVNVERYKPGNKCPACKDGILKSVPIKKAEKATVPEVLKPNVYREYLLYVNSYIRARFYWAPSSYNRKEKLMMDLIGKADTIMNEPIELSSMNPVFVENLARAMYSIAIAIDDVHNSTNTNIIACSSFMDFRARMSRTFGTEDDQ